METRTTDTFDIEVWKKQNRYAHFPDTLLPWDQEYEVGDWVRVCHTHKSYRHSEEIEAHHGGWFQVSKVLPPSFIWNWSWVELERDGEPLSDGDSEHLLLAWHDLDGWRPNIKGASLPQPALPDI